MSLYRKLDEAKYHKDGPREHIELRTVDVQCLVRLINAAMRLRNAADLTPIALTSVTARPWVEFEQASRETRGML